MRLQQNGEFALFPSSTTSNLCRSDLDANEKQLRELVGGEYSRLLDTAEESDRFSTAIDQLAAQLTGLASVSKSTSQMGIS